MGKLKSRKLGVTILLIGATAALSILGQLTPEASQVFTGVGMAYLGGQAAVDFRGKK